ncbi:helix-turn-helix transcriptional regulator, partial [uncultured Brevundimonas sp.]|uniref:helix-turn-helix transcriptional regulator n=1 Tax=uncultured Brevundimonas sp. TaxID=213418 RepID=UPI00261EA7D7
MTVIEAIHAAGLEAERWPDALQTVTRFAGASAASLETYDYARGRHRMWHGYGSEPEMVEAYLSFHSSDNAYAPRRPPGGRTRKFPRGHILDAAGLGREPFYAEFITYTDPRYFVVGILDGGGGPETVFTLTRDPSQGHMDRPDVELFGRLMQHARLAIQVAARLGEARDEARSLTRILDTVGGGVALLDRTGAVLHANAALIEMSACGDGVRLAREGIRLHPAGARERFGAALGAALALGRGETLGAPASFAVARPSGGPPYVLTVRPVFRGEADEAPDAAAVLFVHDPLAGRAARGDGLRALFGLTSAEARLAQALLQGLSPVDHARDSGVSINTAYTHLRRLKDKTGARRLPELIHRLNEATPSPA